MVLSVMLGKKESVVAVGLFMCTPFILRVISRAAKKNAGVKSRERADKFRAPYVRTEYQALFSE